MIRFTNGKVDRHATLGTICSGSLSPEQAERLSDIQDDLADALDVAVAEILAIEVAAKAARISGIAVLCRMAIHKIGADHAED